MLDGAEKLIERVEQLIERASENAKDLAELQAALEAFERAVHAAQDLHEQAGRIIDAHAGFDGTGHVTDPELAADSVEQLAAQLQQVRETVGGPGKALHEALKKFREANRPSDAPSR
jgi:hypothetical protein